MNWIVQARGYDGKWKFIMNSCSESREEAVASLREHRRTGSYDEYRLIRLTTKSEKLRMAIVKELRTIAEEHALYTGVDEAWVHSSETLSAVADRIEKGEVG